MLLIGDYFYYKAKLLFYDWQTRSLFYHHPQFALYDRALLKAYRFLNPYRLSKEFLLKKKEENPHQYGETPIKAYYEIAKTFGLTAEDRVIELGCGRGRGLFFLSAYYGCCVHGIEWNPRFVAIASQIKERFALPKVTFTCEDMFTADLTQATFIYLYGTCLNDDSIEQLIESLKKVAPGTKIVTISYSLAREGLFKLVKELPLYFPWGSTEAYLHIAI